MIDESTLNVNYDYLIEILLLGNFKFSLERYLSIIKASINLLQPSAASLYPLKTSENLKAF